MDLDEVSCPLLPNYCCSPPWDLHCKRNFSGLFFNLFYECLVGFVEREGVDNPNICSPKSFRLFHLPILGIHQIVTSSSCILFVGVQLCLSQVRARLCLLSPCSKWLLWQLLALQPQLSLGFKVVNLTVVV